MIFARPRFFLVFRRRGRAVCPVVSIKVLLQSFPALVFVPLREIQPFSFFFLGPLLTVDFRGKTCVFGPQPSRHVNYRHVPAYIWCGDICFLSSRQVGKVDVPLQMSTHVSMSACLRRYVIRTQH